MEVHRSWIPFNFIGLGKECSTFLKKTRIQELGEQNREGKEREASQNMRLHLYKYYMVGVHQRHCNRRHNLMFDWSVFAAAVQIPSPKFPFYIK